MRSVCLMLVGCVRLCAASLDVFPEGFLVPVDASQKWPSTITADLDGKYFAVASHPSCEIPRCGTADVGYLFERGGIADASVSTIGPSEGGPGPATARSSQGDHLVVWGKEYCLYARVFDQNGVGTAPRLFLIPDPCDPTTARYFTSLEATSGGEGTYLTAWSLNVFNAGEWHSTVTVRELRPSGEWTGQEFTIDPDDYPDVLSSVYKSSGLVGGLCASENGQILLLTLWQRPGSVFSWYVVWLLDSELRLSRPPVLATGDGFEPSGANGEAVAVDASGNFVVAWRNPGQEGVDDTGPFREHILAQRFTNTGEPLGPEISVFGPMPRAIQFRSPQVKMMADGRFVVMWPWVRNLFVMGQRFTSDGEPVGRSFQVNVAGPSNHAIATACDRERFFAVEYHLGSDPGPQTIAVRVIDFNAPDFTRGDANNNDVIDLSDAISILDYLFQAGAPPPVWQAADVNDDETVNVSDPVYLLSHLFLGGAKPPHPYPLPGFDPTG